MKKDGSQPGWRCWAMALAIAAAALPIVACSRAGGSASPDAGGGTAGTAGVGSAAGTAGSVAGSASA
ncbi:MAG: hypothetical protein WCG85_22135, partial [Polyangia bacterium]